MFGPQIVRVEGISLDNLYRVETETRGRIIGIDPENLYACDPEALAFWKRIRVWPEKESEEE